MKLAPILVEYLNAHKQLPLPGIGIFRLETSEPAEETDDKKTKTSRIHFQNDPSVEDVRNLIDFIASKTGKMKTLAASDLMSQLELGHEFLNIDKSFVIEGIGSLTKRRQGEYEFKSEDAIPEKTKSIAIKEHEAAPLKESFIDLKEKRSSKNRTGKLAPLMVIIASIGIAVWVGYKIYEKRVSKNTEAQVKAPKSQEEQAVPVNYESEGTADGSETTKAPEILTEPMTAVFQKPVIKKDSYKFVVEEANKARALQRYNSLKGWGLPLQIETTDSVHFRLFFKLPSSVPDTAKTMDSLRYLYTPVWSRAYVEN